jgi:hypothetical protein
MTSVRRVVVRRLNHIKVMLSDDESQMLWDLAKKESLNASQTLRALLRQEYQLKFGDRKPGGATTPPSLSPPPAAQPQPKKKKNAQPPSPRVKKKASAKP